MPIIAADISSASCALLCASSSSSSSAEWMHSSAAGEAAWRALFTPERDREGDAASLQGSVGASVREMIIRKRGDGWRWVVLYAVREDRPFLLKLV